MELILLEDVRKLGKFGAKVKVARGFGRNFLIPQGKAVPANAENIARFEAQRATLEHAAQERLQRAQERATALHDSALTIFARAAEEGKLYGSIGTYDLLKALKEKGLEVAKQEIRLPNGPLREVGEYAIELQLHAEVTAVINVKIAPETKSNS